MKDTTSTRSKVNSMGVWASVLILLGASCSNPEPTVEDPSLLAGEVTTVAGETLVGIPISAHREGTNITTTVYTNSEGEYSFPDWSDLAPGSHSLSVELPDFEPFHREGIKLSADQTTRQDFTLQPRQPTLADATASEIAMAVEGTEEQRFFLTQCTNCHSIQWALKNPHTKEEWAQIVRRMMGERRASRNTPGTKSYQQKQYIEPIAEYLASIRGPGSTDEIPFKLRPRPTEDASTRLVVTEYDVPRSGEWEPYIIRGDRRFVWPHDIIVDKDYGYYTDHFSNHLGRLDKKTGEVKEFTFSIPEGAGRASVAAGQLRAGNPGGGAHDILFDSVGRVVIGVRGLTVRFDPQTEEFAYWPSGNNMFGIDPDDNVWHVRPQGALYKVSTTSGEISEFELPPVDGIYDQEADSQGRFIINVWGDGKLRLFDPRTETHTDYPTPTPQSGPRRGDMDSQDREWLGLYWAGRLAMFDANRGEVREFPLVPGSQPFGEPFTAPYTAAVDERHQIVWVSDFNSSRIFLFDMKTEKTTEFLMPEPYEVRDLTVDKHAERATLWIPDYRPPAKMVKVQLR